LSKTSNTDMDFTWVTTDDANAIQNAIVDAKGDLIAATANDTPARLAVGSNGDTLVADSSTSTGLRYNPTQVLANPVINGGMDVWARGTTGTSNSYITPSGYNVDRWQNFSNGNAITISRQTVSDSTNLPNIQYAARVQRNSGQTSTNPLYHAQSLETVNSIPFAGKTVTLSFYARAGANFSAASSSLTVKMDSGTGTDQNVLGGYTGGASPVNTSVTLTTTWQRFSATGTIATNVTELGIYFAFTPVGTAGANDWFEITGVQLDVGTWTASTAPTFRRSGGTIQGELAACQRYYWRNSSSTGTFPLVSTGYADSATLAYFPVLMPSEMRVAPTSVNYSSLRVYDAAVLNAVTAVVLGSSTAKVANLAVTTTGLTTGRACALFAGSSGSPFIEINAEL
jgi:hypothetical protein